jgi:hypothetical protein
MENIDCNRHGTGQWFVACDHALAGKAAFYFPGECGTFVCMACLDACMADEPGVVERLKMVCSRCVEEVRQQVEGFEAGEC